MAIRNIIDNFEDRSKSLEALNPVPLYSLPSTAQEIARLISLPATLRLVKQFGGMTLRIPHGTIKPGQDYLASLANVVGDEAAKKLVQKYSGDQVYIPNCKDALVKARDKQLIADRNFLAKGDMSERDIVAILVTRYNISDRQIWKILKKPLEEKPMYVQKTLFDL